MMVTVTDNAMDKVADLLANQPDMAGVRVFVYGGGCSGMQHSMTFADVKEERDIELAPNLYIDPVAIQFMDGATIDYDDVGMNPTFRFLDVFKAQGGSGMCGGCGASTGPGYSPH
jgi:iron-sulfur cluster assembly accessory protein